MTAVATKPQAKKAKAPAAAAVKITPVTEVAAALLSILEKVNEAYSGSDSEALSIHAHTLAEMAKDETWKLSQGEATDESAATYRIAACIAGARAYDMVDSPTCGARHAMLQQAYELAESASISFGFVQEPCEALAVGIKAGQTAYTPTQPASAEDDGAARIRIAFDANYGIERLAGALKAHYMRDAGDDWPVYEGILGRIQQLSEVVFYAMRLSGTDDGPSLKTLQRFLDGHLGLILKDEK